MAKLKGFIFSLDGVALAEGKQDEAGRERREEFRKLIRFLVSKGVRPIVLANRPWTVTKGKSGEKLSAREYYAEIWGPEVRWYIAQEDGFPLKPQAAALEHVLRAEGLDGNEVVFLGNDDDDMRTAVNGKVLFLTAGWQPSAPTSEYGFRFESARDVARFVDVFCLRDHLWYYEVPAINLRTLGLISSRDSVASRYSDDAIYTFKQKGPRHRDFWTKYLVSTLYFAGVHRTPNLIVAPYPGHGIGYDNEVVRDALVTFAKCFRMPYCPDLIVRHTKATKSQEARRRGISLDHRMQLETIHLTDKPRKYGGEAYKNSPFTKPRSVLVVDDFTTEGYGLDSARAYLRSVKKVKDVLLVSLGRFPNRDVHELRPLPKIANPFVPNKFSGTLPVVVHSYTGGVVNPASTREIAEHFAAYDTWDWPPDL
jgi:hypothetical protein